MSNKNKFTRPQQVLNLTRHFHNKKKITCYIFTCFYFDQFFLLYILIKKFSQLHGNFVNTYLCNLIQSFFPVCELCIRLLNQVLSQKTYKFKCGPYKTHTLCTAKFFFSFQALWSQVHDGRKVTAAEALCTKE